MGVALGIYTLKTIACTGASLGLMEACYTAQKSLETEFDEDGAARAKLAARIFEVASIVLASAAMAVIGYTLAPSAVVILSAQNTMMLSLPFWLGAATCDRVARSIKTLWTEEYE